MHDNFVTVTRHVHDGHTTCDFCVARFTLCVINDCLPIARNYFFLLQEATADGLASTAAVTRALPVNMGLNVVQ